MALATQRIKTALSGYVKGWSNPDVQAAAIKLLDALDNNLDQLDYEQSPEVDEATSALDEALDAADEADEIVDEDDPE